MATEQEQFWQGEFGNDYIDRNSSEELRASNLRFFAQIASYLQSTKSALELGANVGLNLEAISKLIPGILLDAVEINAVAHKQLVAADYINETYLGSILNFHPDKKYDLVFTKTVLIHIAPEDLEKVYETIDNASQRYVLMAEYYNPAPTTISYRSHSNKLFKRDFAGDFMSKFPQYELVKYGFSYHKDPVFPQDDITWFLLEKNIS